MKKHSAKHTTPTETVKRTLTLSHTLTRTPIPTRTAHAAHPTRGYSIFRCFSQTLRFPCFCSVCEGLPPCPVVPCSLLVLVAILTMHNIPLRVSTRVRISNTYNMICVLCYFTYLVRTPYHGSMGRTGVAIVRQTCPVKSTCDGPSRGLLGDGRPRSFARETDEACGSGALQFFGAAVRCGAAQRGAVRWYGGGVVRAQNAESWGYPRGTGSRSINSTQPSRIVDFVTFLPLPKTYHSVGLFSSCLF